MKPFTSERNLTPSSTAPVSESLTTVGVAELGQIVHGHDPGVLMTVTVVPTPGVSRLPLSSAARVLIVTEPSVAGVHAYVQLSRPLARRHVAPPSTETSTPPTTPPPPSVAVPLIVTSCPSCTVAPAIGEVTNEDGATESVDAEAATSPD